MLRDNDGGEINDPTEVSNMFGNYFSNVALNLDRSIILLSQADPMSSQYSVYELHATSCQYLVFLRISFNTC